MCIVNNYTSYVLYKLKFLDYLWLNFCTESDSKEEVCQVDLGLNCHGKVDAAEPYDFAVKLSANTKLELNDDLVAIYGCDTEVSNSFFLYI